jgi:hypothetical protein
MEWPNKMAMFANKSVNDQLVARETSDTRAGESHKAHDTGSHGVVDAARLRYSVGGHRKW